MKKLVLTIGTILIFSLIILFNTNAFASIENVEAKDGVIKVSGIGSKEEIRENVLLHLYYGEYNSEKPEENLISIGQTLTKGNGIFSYDFPLPKNYNEGLFTVRMGDSSGIVSEKQTMVTTTENVQISLTSNNAGHIYFSPENITFNAQVSNLSSNNKTYNFAVRVINTETKEEIYKDILQKTDFNGLQTKNFQINFGLADQSKQFGIFEAFVYPVPNYIKNPWEYEAEEASIRFSVVMKSEEQNEKLGMHTQFGHGYAKPEINCMLLKNSGFSSIRDYLDASQCIDSNGNWFNPTRYSAWKDDTKNNNIDQLLLYSYYGKSVANTESDILKFRNYAVKTAQQLVKDGVYDYELLNEVNWDDNLTTENYAKLIIGVAPYVKAVDPKIKLIAFASAGIDNYHSVNYIINTLKKIQELGYDPHDLIDYISVHPYKPLNQYPEKVERTHSCTYGTESYGVNESGHQYDLNDAFPGDSSLTARTENLLFRLKADVNCGDIPLMITELGWYSLEGASTQTSCETCIKKEVTSLSETGQANYTVRATALLYDYYDKIYYHTLNNKPSTTSNHEVNYGFTKCFNNDDEIPYEAKPVYLAMSAFNNIIGNSKLKEKNLSQTKNFYDYVFDNNGKIIHMMWSPLKKSNRTLNTSEKQIIVRDTYGNIINTGYSDSKSFTLYVSDSPIYVEEVIPTAKLSFYDEKGNLINNLNNVNKISVELSIGSDLNLEKGNFVISFYENNTLLKTEINKITSNETTFKTELFDVENVNSIKAFYWKENQEPIINNITITAN